MTPFWFVAVSILGVFWISLVAWSNAVTACIKDFRSRIEKLEAEWHSSLR